MNVTKAEARKEIQRRKAPRGSVARRKWARAEVTALSGAQLKAIVEGTPATSTVVVSDTVTGMPVTVKVAPVKPVKPEPVADCKGPDGTLRTPVEARKAASAWRIAEFHQGRKVSYKAACEAFGTTRAKDAV